MSQHNIWGKKCHENVHIKNQIVNSVMVSMLFVLLESQTQLNCVNVHKIQQFIKKIAWVDTGCTHGALLALIPYELKQTIINSIHLVAKVYVIKCEQEQSIIFVSFFQSNLLFVDPLHYSPALFNLPVSLLLLFIQIKI